MTSTVIADHRPETVHIQVWHGDDWTHELRFVTGAGDPLDLTGLTFTSQARSTLGQLTELVVTVPIPTNGTVYLQPPPAGLTPDLYDYDLQADEAGTITTRVRGRIRVDQDVTP
jgi:hypothetical protein